MRHFEHWLQSYMEYSAYSEAPDKFHFWTGIGTLAGALRRRVWIDMGYFQWTPNFYIIFVAPPGIVSKSTTMSIGMKLLRQLPDIKFGPDAVTWQALTMSLAASMEEVLIDEAFYPMSCITIASSEFGTFLNPNDREMVDVLVSLWDGQVGTWTKATKTMGNDSIVNPWINILACTTPSWIAGNFPEYMIGGGFTSRCVFVYAEKKRHLVAYPKDQLPPNFEEQGQKLVHDLEVISQLKGEYKLDKQAKALGEAWYENHYGAVPTHLNNDQFAGYLARKQTHIHKLALVLSAAQHDELIIGEAELEHAIKITESIESDMPKVFSKIGRSDEVRPAEQIVAYIQAHGKTSAGKLFRDVFGQMTHKEFQDALTGAIAAGFVQQQQHGSELFILPLNMKEKENVERPDEAVGKA